MDSHLDIGTIQAFLDRELEQTASARVSNHVAACDACARLLAEAEDESAVVFSALAREFDSMVPTQRLWSKINDAIEIERRETPFWRRALGYLRFALMSPSLATAAGVLLVVGIIAVMWMDKTAPTTNQPVNEVARTVAPAVTTPIVRGPVPENEPRDSGPSFKIERAAYRPEPRRVTTRTATATSPAPTDTADPMPGEESYVKTIANLSKSVDDKKDTVLRPSQLVAYERDMAVVNDAINKMRQEVKRNPNNRSARQVLYTSYQNKIDLLNSVSQKEELMASLR